MQVMLPNIETRASLRIRERRMTDGQYWNFCAQNPDLRIEREANGDLIIMPPTGAETGFRNLDLGLQVAQWAKKDGRGRAFDSNTEYLLPDGSARSPDVSWVLKSRLNQFTKEQKKKFLPLCPDFIVELTSPTDRLHQVKLKMLQWMDNGARLGWLIDADRRTIYIYRPGQPLEERKGVNRLMGDGPLKGFRLDLTDIWNGL